MYFKKFKTLVLASALTAASASVSFAQSSQASDCQVSPNTFKQECFCEDRLNETKYPNAYDEYCLALPGGDQVTNFAPLIAPLVGVAGLAGLAGGGGSTTSTTSTTSN